MHGLDEGFHWRDGWYFRRDQGNGTVRITRAEPGHELVQIRIPAMEWASIVASMSDGGESAESHAKALAFHQGHDLNRREGL
jgi:hypothetical protein